MHHKRRIHELVLEVYKKEWRVGRRRESEIEQHMQDVIPALPGPQACSPITGERRVGRVTMACALLPEFSNQPPDFLTAVRRLGPPVSWLAGSGFVFGQRFIARNLCVGEEGGFGCVLSLLGGVVGMESLPYMELKIRSRRWPSTVFPEVLG